MSKMIKLPVLGAEATPANRTVKTGKTVALISLGCPKNQVDSEVILGNLKYSQIVDSAEDADTIVINTCGFIESAKKESIDTILQAIALKNRASKKGVHKEIIVTGCLSERYPEELAKSLPEVDAFFGVHEFDKVTSRIEGHYQQVVFSERRLLNQRHYAYLKISEGCNQRCGFCYIPMIRGNLVSKTIDQNVAEAKALAAQGVKELLVVSQDTSSYGYDFDRSAPNLKRNAHLIKLLTSLGAIETIHWIRLMYLYPSLFSDDLVDLIAEHPKLCKYVDLPIQHISDAVLKSMRRNTSQQQTLDLLRKIRSRIPSVSIRTSLIVGYPGETEKDFEDMCEFVREFKFERLGVFMYSKEEGTYANELKGQVSAKVKTDRYNHLMEIQRGVSLELNHAKIGRTLKVLIDSKEAGHYVGRTEYDAPEIDNEVLIETAEELAVGDFVDVQILDATEYDIYATPLIKEPV